MKKLQHIISTVALLNTVGTTNIDVSGLTFDSRAVQAGYVFFATKGEATDGHLYIGKAIEAGAVAVVCETLPDVLAPHICYLQVADATLATALMASAYYGHPADRLTLVGITGTNGKTTIATLLYDLFTRMGYHCGLISTIAYQYGDTVIKASHTTPDAIRLNAMLCEMADNGCEFCFMEVSSHAVVQNRVAGLNYAMGIFTNLTHDHLDYHKTFKEYLTAKKQFFDTLNKDAIALTNADDKNGMVMLQNCKAHQHTYALRTMADYKCKVVEQHIDGMLLDIDHREVWTKFTGAFNAHNLLAVYATAVLLGGSPDEVLMHISAMNPVKGRFQTLHSANKVTAVIDYAHTPDALKNVLLTINEIRTDAQSIITVVGAGGNRDKTKRPIMAATAVQHSDRVILTSDNPRNEDPNDIINDMLAGLSTAERNQVMNIADRREAIRTACMFAAPGDIILVAGKGHEDYQEVNGQRTHFDDEEVVRQMFEAI